MTVPPDTAHARTAPDETPAPRPAPGTAHDGEALRVVTARHPWRLASAAVVLVLLAMAASALITNPAWDWPVVGEYLFAPAILRAVAFTLQLTALGIVLGFVIGTVVALMRMSSNPLLTSVAWGYTWLFRSVPLILQLLFWYNLALLYKYIEFGVPFGPSFFSIGTMELIGPVTAAAIGLALHQGAYAAEIVRAGFLSVDPGQLEAAAALGIPRTRQIFRILLPQAMRTIVPTAGNEIIGLVKGTSVVYIMALPELFYQAQVIYNRSGRVIALLLVAAIWYLILTTVLSIAQYYLERHYARGTSRLLPDTPLRRLRRALAGRGATATGSAP
ncbi:putative amino acid ABC transporter, permease protein [Sphaerisporangium krabiense]|uniref:Polar amino acid transport system permease protein n=1 Tax=Sphaerisporangium krabiense TaxID=763782 RepID=A0A7W9DS66_9ACTN|nr:amino acid ABC transporter permease [Sphaerisporangium krabiense]MBB5629362.1 polar amino acid transport system permease protein [Sphaerisporangium krabiense]GII65787.1 putative amino acid ABC transporter, permease protein [Sphaerisporangium krabiense]